MVIRRMLYHYRRLQALHPKYDDCPSWCPVEERDRRDFCEACEAGASFRAMRDGVADELRRRHQDALRSYSIETLVADATSALSLRRPRNALEEVIAAIVRSERLKMRRVDDWNREQEQQQTCRIVDSESR